jgi:hypothetical protein
MTYAGIYPGILYPFWARKKLFWERPTDDDVELLAVTYIILALSSHIKSHENPAPSQILILIFRIKYTIAPNKTVGICTTKNSQNSPHTTYVHYDTSTLTTDATDTPWSEPI